MKQPRVSNRYAKSVLALAAERNELAAVREDLLLVGNSIRQSRELSNALSSPIIKSDAKMRALRSIFAGKVGELTSQFMEILVRKGRESLLQEVCEAFEAQYKALKNITTVEVTTAIVPGDQLRVHIESFVGRMKSALGITGEIDLIEKVKPTIMGGFIVQAGDLQIDQSVSRQFDDLRIEFSKNPYISEL